MRTNIERAINDLILSNKDITLANALPAYLREAGFEKMTPDALVAFEHALDKYPTRRGGSRAVVGKSISKITREYWSNKPDIIADIRSCYCDACASKLFNLGAGVRARVSGSGYSEQEEKASKYRLKLKKRRRVRAEREVVAARVDPDAPSTSTVRP